MRGKTAAHLSARSVVGCTTNTEEKMRRKYVLEALVVAFLLVWSYLAPALLSAQGTSAQSEHTIKIDVPVRLEKANVVFNVDHLAFAGDMPVGIKYMNLLANRVKEMGIKGQIIGIFHGDAAYMTLNDKAYNACRNVSTGNPYKALIAELVKQGVQIEECAVSMKRHDWVNDDLLPWVKVNTGAVGRLIQLGQQGYVQIQP
jgi:intracellular sulfur oxidation DsrE/DsrF family protein